MQTYIKLTQVVKDEELHAEFVTASNNDYVLVEGEDGFDYAEYADEELTVALNVNCFAVFANSFSGIGITAYRDNAGDVYVKEQDAELFM